MGSCKWESMDVSLRESALRHRLHRNKWFPRILEKWKIDFQFEEENHFGWEVIQFHIRFRFGSTMERSNSVTVIEYRITRTLSQTRCCVASI